MGKKKDSLELYFHIPFCIKIRMKDEFNYNDKISKA